MTLRKPSKPGEPVLRMYKHPETVRQGRAERLAQLEAEKLPCEWCGLPWAGVRVQHPGCEEALAAAAAEVAASEGSAGGTAEGPSGGGS